MDIADTIAAKSDQLNAEDLLAGTQVVQITDARVVGGDQPVELVTDVFGPARPFKPCKTVRRLLVKAWGPHSSEYIGRRMAIFNDPTVKWAGQAVGGIRISALSHIDGALDISLTETRGNRKKHHVDPLPDAPSKIPVSFDAKIPTSTLEQCAQARDYLAKYADTEPERVAALFDKVAARESQLAQEVSE